MPASAHTSSRSDDPASLRFRPELLTRRALLHRSALLASLTAGSSLLAACAPNSAGQAQPGAAAGAPAAPPATKADKITFMTPPWGIPPNDDALKAFQTKAGFQVEVQSLPISDLFTKAQTASATNLAPADVIFLSEEAPSNIIAPGYMEPLESYLSDLDTSDFVRMDFWKNKSKQYAVSSYTQLVMLNYNQKRLAEAGFSAPAKSWTEFDAQAKAIKQKGTDQFPISFNAIDWSWYLMALSMGDQIVDDKLEPSFAQPGSKAREAMAMLLNWYRKDKLISADLLSPTNTAFQSGVGSFRQAWQGSLSLFNNAEKSKQAPDVRYMLMPDAHFTWTLDAGLGISKNSKAKQQAWQFIKWYTEPDQQKAIYKAYGLFPSRLAVSKELAAAGDMEGFDAIQEQDKYVHQLPRYAPWWGQFTSFVSETVQRGFQGSDDPNALVDAIGKKWNDLKAEQR